MGIGMRSNGTSREIRSLIVGLFLFLFVASATIFAQLPTATILGVVKDSSGSVIPDVNLTARNVDTGQTRTTTTDANGAYRLPALPVGNYEVRGEKTGCSNRGQQRVDSRRRPGSRDEYHAAGWIGEPGGFGNGRSPARKHHQWFARRIGEPSRRWPTCL